MSKVPHGNTEDDKKGRKIGLALTLCLHAVLFLIFFNAGFKTVYPPPEEKGILLEFVPEETKPIEVKAGIQPRAQKASPDKDIRLVQKSQAREQGEKPSQGRETTLGPDGDIPKPEPPRPPIDRRALFTSAENHTDTLTEQTAERVSDALKAGHPDGNARSGDISNEPSARLQGRNVVGALPFPEYKVNKAGKVVVRIMVDQYGKVTNAIPGVQGTTVQDKVLWEAAREAAYKAAFNVSSSAPPVQEGTITYIFRLE